MAKAEKQGVTDGVANAPHSSGELSETSHYGHSLVPIAVNGVNNTHSSQPRSLQQGENWLRFDPPADNGNVKLQSIDPLPSDQSFICIDVDRQVAAIKDMRTRGAPPTAQDIGTIEIHLSRRIRKRDRVETYGPNANHRISELGGYDSDDENEGDDFSTGRPERPKKYHAPEALPKKQMRILHQGDRIVLKDCRSQEQTDTNGFILEYRHHRMVHNKAAALEEKQVAFAVNINGGAPAAAALNCGGNADQPPLANNVRNMLKPTSVANSSGSTSVSTSKAVIVPPKGMNLAEQHGSNVEQEGPRSVDDDTEARSYLTGEVLVQEQGYVSAITAPDEYVINAELAQLRTTEATLQNAPVQPDHKEANAKETTAMDVGAGESQRNDMNGNKAESQRNDMNGDKSKEEEDANEAAKASITPGNAIETRDGEDRDINKAQGEDVVNESLEMIDITGNEVDVKDGQDALTGVQPQNEESKVPANAVEDPAMLDGDQGDDGSSTSGEYSGASTQPFPLPAALSTQLSADEQISDDETTMGESTQPDAKDPIAEQSPIDPYDQPTQPLLLPSENEGDQADSSTEGKEEANEKIDDEAMQEEETQKKEAASQQEQRNSTSGRSVDDPVDKGTPCSDASCNLLDDVENEAGSRKPEKALETTVADKEVNGSQDSKPASQPGTQPLSPHGEAFDYSDQDEENSVAEQVQEEIDGDGPVRGVQDSGEGVGAVHQVASGAMMTGPVGTAEGMNSEQTDVELPALMKQTPQNTEDTDRIQNAKQESNKNLKGTESSELKAVSKHTAEVDEPLEKCDNSENANEAIAERSRQVLMGTSEEKRSDSKVAVQETNEDEPTNAGAQVSPTKAMPASEAPLLSQPAGNVLRENETAVVSEHDGRASKQSPQMEAPCKSEAPSNGSRFALPSRAETSLHNTGISKSTPTAVADNRSPLRQNGAKDECAHEDEKYPELQEPGSETAGRIPTYHGEQGNAKEEKQSMDAGAPKPGEFPGHQHSQRSAETAELLLTLTTKENSSEKRRSEETSPQCEKEAQDEKMDEGGDEHVGSVGVAKDSNQKGAPTTPVAATQQITKDARSGNVAVSPPSTRKRSRVSSARNPSAKRAKIKSEFPDKSTNIRVITTGVKATQRHKMMIEKLGGVLLEKIEDAADATHVIAGDSETPLRRTPKLMIGLCRTSNVVDMDWLIKSAKARHALDCSDFLLLNDDAAEKKYDFCMRDTLKNGEKLRRKNRCVLTGWFVYVCKGVAGKKAPPEAELRLIVDAADGKWLHSLAASKIANVDPSRILVVTSDPAPKKQVSSRDVAKTLRAGAHDVTTSWLFHCMITQELAGFK